MKKYVHHSKFFYGNEISDYGLLHGYVDYGTLARSFDCILNNDIMTKTSDIGYWELVNGNEYYYCDKNGNYYDENEKEEKIEELENRQEELEKQQEELDENSEKYKDIESQLYAIQEDIDSLNDEYYNEYYQYYIISENGYRILEECTDETIWYNEELDMYVWGVSHFGTSWSYVLTNIKIDLNKE